LVQRSSFTKSGENIASSQVIRFYGTWLRFGSPEGNSGRLVWKTETRNPFGRNPTPREMGFDTGSVLSTANYKDLNYWGITDLYWKQGLQGGKYGFLVGHMDPGDWADQYPLLNAWTSFLNDAFYNNPTEAIPQRGFGLVGQVFLSTNTYILAGVHDANGKDGKLDYSGLSDTGELFSWVEYGYRSQRDISARHNAHIHFWHQDQRDEAETEESWGVAYTQSIVTKRDGVAFLRAGWSRGDAAQMRRFIGVGASYTPRGWDTLGIATSWGSPPETSLRNQITSEVFYRVQITQNLTMSPDIQIVYHPSYTKDESWVFTPGLRMRLVF
jgi:porin